MEEKPLSDNIDADIINVNPPPADKRVANINGGDSESRLSILSQFAINLVDVTDKEELLWLVARDVVSKLGFVDCVIYEVIEQKGVLIQQAAYGIKNPHHKEIVNRLEIKIGDGVTGKVAKFGKSVIISDVSLESSYIADIVSNLSEIAVPVIYSGKIYGVIDCEDPRRDYFNKSHLRSLTTVAAMLSSKLLQYEINDELAQSNRALNAELVRCKKIERELENHKKLLEDKVDQRTADLQASIDELIRETHLKIEAESELRVNQEMLYQSAKMASIGVLAAGVAHEINNPIAFVKSNLQSIEEMLQDLSPIKEIATVVATHNSTDDMSEETRSKLLKKFDELADPVDVLTELPEIIDAALDGTDRVIQIVSELKEYSHQDIEEKTLNDINLLLDKAAALAANELKYKATLIKEYSDELPELKCWGDKLVQVFLNLLVNAVQAIDSKGDINIQTQLKGANIKIMICDSGCGMTEETRLRMFDPFFTTKSVGVGTGLGMHISYNIIENHKGKISVVSELHKGTAITIILPIHPHK